MSLFLLTRSSACPAYVVLILWASCMAYGLTCLGSSREAYMEFWSWWWFEGFFPPFLDLQMLTTIGPCFKEQGFGVYSENVCDPLQRPYNYPALLLLPALFGFSAHHTSLIGILFFLLLVLSMGILIRWSPKNCFSSLVWLLALFSPPVSFGVERGNIDILILSSLILGYLFLRRSLLYYGLLIISAMIKLYPLFGILIVGGEKTPRRAFRILYVTAGVFFTYWWLFRDTLGLAIATTGSSISHGYGSQLTAIGLMWQLGLPPRLAAWLPLLGLLLVLALAWSLRIRYASSPELGEKEYYHDSLDLFRVGSGIFLGSFALRIHFTYRLIFLLLLIPLLLLWTTGSKESYRKKLGFVTLSAIILTLWLQGIPFFSRLWIDEYFLWITVSTITTVLLSDLPKEWMQRSKALA